MSGMEFLSRVNTGYRKKAVEPLGKSALIGGDPISYMIKKITITPVVDQRHLKQERILSQHGSQHASTPS